MKKWGRDREDLQAPLVSSFKKNYVNICIRKSPEKIEHDKYIREYKFKNLFVMQKNTEKIDIFETP